MQASLAPRTSSQLGSCWPDGRAGLAGGFWARVWHGLTDRGSGGAQDWGSLLLSRRRLERDLAASHDAAMALSLSGNATHRQAGTLRAVIGQGQPCRCLPVQAPMLRSCAGLTWPAEALSVALCRAWHLLVTPP